MSIKRFTNVSFIITVIQSFESCAFFNPLNPIQDKIKKKYLIDNLKKKHKINISKY